MPRLLPRLLNAPTSKRVVVQAQDGSRKRKSLYRPTPVSLPSFHPGGRTRSILLDENPMTDKRAFARHKRLPPRGDDRPRARVVVESIPMLATPLRQCTISKRYLPNDFLIRLAVLRLPATQNARPLEVLMPDGLEHPTYKRRKARVAVYVTCWKAVVKSMKSPVVVPRCSPNVYFSKHLCSHIGYLLRLRVLQELDVLIDALKQDRGRVEFDVDANPTILRRLTRAESKALRETGTIPFPDAAAVLVVPPVNRDPRTKERPRPSREPEIPSSDMTPNSTHEKALPPLSTLHDVCVSEVVPEQGVDMELSRSLPNARIPLYNGVSIFPSAPHRAAFHGLLTKLLNLERHFRGTHPNTTKGGLTRAKGDAKASHAFLLVSNAHTVKRADTAPLAIALWRLRMWEGDAFGDTVEGWEIGKEWRTEQSSRT